MKYSSKSAKYSNNIFNKLSLIAATLVVLFSATNVFAVITGTVFRDLPVNGTALNTYGTEDANELGVAGVEVTAYDNLGAAVGPVTTDLNGDYTLSTGAGDYRIEFSKFI